MTGATLTTPTAWADWLVVLPVVLPLVFSALLLALRDWRAVQAPLAGLVVAAVLVCDVLLLQRTLDTGPLAMTMGRWLPPFGISFAADVVGASFAVAAALVTLIILVYMQMDQSEGDLRGGVYPLVLLLLAGVGGAFLTGDLFNLYVWFEVMLISSFGLFVLRARELQIDAALKYGFLNFLATTIFLAALGVLYGLLGTLNLADIARVAPAAEPAVLTAVAGLLLVAFGMKAAAFPLNAWLPASYHAPPAALSALMAGLLTKVGVYALLRTLVVMLPASRDVLHPVLVVIAVATLLLGPLGAIAETNLRRALGFLVIGGIGSILAGMALPSLEGMTGATFYTVHAMLTMTALYLVAGLIERVTGEVDSRAMGGLYHARPLLAVMFFVLVLAVAGVPPFLGFWPKLFLLQAALAPAAAVAAGPAWLASVLAVALMLNALLTLFAGARLWSHIFWREGPAGGGDTAPAIALTAAPLGAGLVATVALVGIVLAAGLWPEALIVTARIGAAGLLDPAAYFAAFGLGVLP